jgi:SNF2 family DNA or RNA helicase
MAGEYMREVKFRIGNKRFPITLVEEDKVIQVRFNYNPTILAEVKTMQGARWHPDDKIWTIANSPRNRFNIEYLTGGNPYAWYDRELEPFTPSREMLYKHQIEMAAMICTYRRLIIAAEMGTGKTLAMIEAMEQSSHTDWWWVGPRAALYSVQLDFQKWKSKVTPRFLTYEELKKTILAWPKGKKPPQGVVYDESSRIKNHTAERSKAALHLSQAIKMEWGDEGWVVEMSGTPAPKSPLDWWHQCEVACPGYLKEGDPMKLQKRLAIIEQRENITGGVYPHLVAWKDDERKCADCGKLVEDVSHDLSMGGHTWQKSINEIEKLYRRMKGLVYVKFKKDCLDLPEKQYKIIECKPSRETLRLASIIKEQTSKAAQALILLRELSDGFQYDTKEIGSQTCPTCKGTRTWMAPFDKHNPELPIGDAEINSGHVEIAYREEACPTCSGVGEVIKYARSVLEVESPKETALANLLEEYEDVGRVVIYAGFTGSIEKCIKVVSKENWQFIRVDGRGWTSSIGGSPTELLEIFQSGQKKFDRLAFIGHPASAGMGLTLTASPVNIFYSNDFNYESRAQSEDRIHRLGMDLNRGAMIIDLVHLETDRYILDNLKKKRRLQDITLGELNAVHFDK